MREGVRAAFWLVGSLVVTALITFESVLAGAPSAINVAGTTLALCGLVWVVAESIVTKRK